MAIEFDALTDEAMVVGGGKRSRCVAYIFYFETLANKPDVIDDR